MDITLSTEGSSLKLLTLKRRGRTMYGNFLPVLVQFKISLEIYSSFSECLLLGIMPSCLELFLTLQIEPQIFVL